MSRHVGTGVPLSRLPVFSEKPAKQPVVVIHGWTIFAHPLFLAQYEKLLQQVAELRSKDPNGYEKKNAAKRLAAIVNLAFDVIPQDPTRPEYQQDSTLGNEHKHWFRAKFFQQYRLFFRFHALEKVIVLGWVNDEDTKHAYESGAGIPCRATLVVALPRLNSPICPSQVVTLRFSAFSYQKRMN